MLRRSLFAISALLIACLAAPVAFGQAHTPVPGKDYLQLSSPQPTETPGKNEVIEFFWYRCPHCYSLEPYLESWVKKLPRDTQFRLVPAVFNAEWALDARIFYALDALGLVERLHRGLFDAIHKQGGAALKGEAYTKWVAAWLAKQGIDMAKYDAALHSFSVDSNVKRAFQTARAYKLDGVPAIAINGRYLISASMVGDREGMINTAQQVLDLARKHGLAKK